MRSERTIILALILILGILSQVLGTTYRVPQDEEDIESALSRARGGDTVLVADGIYQGDHNTDLEPRAGVILISENGPDNCIIDGGDDEDTAVTLEDRVVLSGFTIRRFDRTVVYVNGKSNFTISHCVFQNNVNRLHNMVALKVTGRDSRGLVIYCDFERNNCDADTGWAIATGAAIWVTNRADLEIESCFFANNNADSTGGAVHISGSDVVTIRNCIFRNNEARIGGAISATGGNTRLTISFCNILSNVARTWGGGLYIDANARVNISNCIIWGNDGDWGDQMAVQRGNDHVPVHHCIIEGGEDQEAGWFGDDLIEERARFEVGRGPIWGPNTYYLRENSPGVDQGSDPAEDLGMDQFTTRADDQAPDEGTVDIGFHYNLDLYYALGRLSGLVIDTEDNELLPGVDIITSLGQVTRTDRNGSWVLNEALADTIFNITATLPGYNDSTQMDIELAEGELVEINFALYHPEFAITPHQINSEVELSDTGFVDLTISNGGNGPLYWDTRVELVGDQNVEPWSLRRSYEVEEVVGDHRLEGVVYIDGLFYISGRADDPHLIYVINEEGAWVDTFPQFTDERNGIVDMDWDGELIWGVQKDSVFGFTTDGELMASWPQHINYAKTLTYDPDREVLWFSHNTSDIACYNRAGERVLEDDLDRQRLKIYGLAYWSDDPDEMPLYLLTRLTGDDTGYIYKMNPDTEDTMFVRALEIPGGKPEAAFITSDMDPFSMNLIMIGDDDISDRVDIYQMCSNTTWMVLDPDEGSVDPESEMNILVSLFDEQFGHGEYEGQLIINHNAEGGEEIIPINLLITSIPETDPPLPLVSALESVYPNPFNAEVVLNYSVAQPGLVSLIIYDLTGREVAVLLDNYHNAGRYRSTVGALDWAAGVYLARFETAGKVRIAKLVCVK